MKNKSLFNLIVFICFSLFLSVVPLSNNSTINDSDEFENVQDPDVLPVGTLITIKSTKEIYAKSFKAGDHFFVELNKDITMKGKVVVPAGTMVQIDVLVSDNKKHKTSTFGVTIGGFIIDNYLQQVKTENKMVTTEDNSGQAVKKVAIGAGLGAAFGRKGRNGALKGAAVGGALGLLEPGQVIHFPRGTEATFQLALPLKVTWL